MWMMMMGEKLLSPCLAWVVIAVVLINLPPISNAKGGGGGLCNPSSCGHILNIGYPFRLKSDPPACGDTKYELVCENNTRAVLSLNSDKYYVKAINYNNFTIRVAYAGGGVDHNYCSSLPRTSLTTSSFGSEGPYSLSKRDSRYPYMDLDQSIKPINFLSCRSPVDSPLYVDSAPCTVNKSSYASTGQYSYFTIGLLNASMVREQCSVELVVMTSSPRLLRLDNEAANLSFTDVQSGIAYGFELFWFKIHCATCNRRHCYMNATNDVRCEGYLIHRTYTWIDVIEMAPGVIMYGLAATIALNIALRIVCGIPCMLTILIYKLWRRHLPVLDNIEDYLRSQYKNLIPIRYSYPQIKKMTRGFKDKLGEGGYGCIYKGKLRSGSPVAIKILGKTKANGQEFVNEVATIRRIHHVNVVKLIGYCAERSKRALVYDFMPHGSLEKYIFPRENGIVSLSYKKLYEISLGVARGIEYLHRGCDMQILHFDIKPHNILLDENFTPKVSDFGLAKLYPTKDSIVSLTAARGTMGYMAPELFYKNIEGIFYKADVYSFGMLLLEMARKRKNLNAFADHSSQIYFPSWAHSQIGEGKDIEMGDTTDKEREMVKKMIIVALWCIQMKPSDRPSMHKVVEMLEGNIELLQLPPKLDLCPEELPTAENSQGANAAQPIQSNDSIDFITLDITSA